MNIAQILVDDRNVKIESKFIKAYLIKQYSRDTAQFQLHREMMVFEPVHGGVIHTVRIIK